MALISVTKRCVPADGLVYTVPAGKAARVLSCIIQNGQTPPADVDITIRWHDNSAGAAGTDYDFLNAARLRQNEWFSPFAADLSFDAGDTLSVIPLTGHVDVVLSLDVTP